MDAISDFFIMLYYVCIAVPCVIGLLVGAAMLKQNWDTLSDNERMARVAGCAILMVFGVLVPLSFSYPALYAFLVSLAPFLLLLPVAGWIFYIFAVTRLGQQLDQASDDIHTIARNSNKD